MPTLTQKLFHRSTGAGALEDLILTTPANRTRPLFDEHLSLMAQVPVRNAPGHEG